MTADNHTSTDSAAAVTANKIVEALQGLRFGSVEITVHEGRIVQIERREKLRLSLPLPEASGASAA